MKQTWPRDLDKVVAGDICHHLTTKINIDVASANDSSDSESDDDIIDVIEQDSNTESDEDGDNIGDNNNGRLRQTTFSRSGRIQGNWLTRKWFRD